MTLLLRTWKYSYVLLLIPAGTEGEVLEEFLNDAIKYGKIVG